MEEFYNKKHEGYYVTKQKQTNRHSYKHVHISGVFKISKLKLTKMDNKFNVFC